MTTPNELSNRPIAQRKPATWADLERGLAATLPALGRAHLVISAKVGHRFVQFASDPEDGLRAETVSNAYLEPDDRHDDAQVAQLLELGWKEPTHAPDAPQEERVDRGSPNYFLDWTPPAVPWDEVARLAVQTLRIIGVTEPDALEYHAWDDADRPLSLPALRLARRKEKHSERPARPTSKAKRAKKPDPISPAARKVKAELLAATRIFAADNSLQYDKDGDIPIRIGNSPAWVRMCSSPLVVRIYCIVAHDLPITEALLRRLHELNREWFLARLIVGKDTVYASVDIPADPFCVEHFTAACSAIRAMEGEYANDRQGKFGAEPEAAV